MEEAPPTLCACDLKPGLPWCCSHLPQAPAAPQDAPSALLGSRVAPGWAWGAAPVGWLCE